jgi:hypothetical protein
MSNSDFKCHIFFYRYLINTNSSLKSGQKRKRAIDEKKQKGKKQLLDIKTVAIE